MKDMLYTRNEILELVQKLASSWTDESALEAFAEVAMAVSGEEWGPKSSSGIEKKESV